MRNVSADISSYHGTWVEIERRCLTACEEICRKTSGRRGEERETWWRSDSLKAVVDERIQHINNGNGLSVNLTKGYTKREIDK